MVRNQSCVALQGGLQEGLPPVSLCGHEDAGVIDLDAARRVLGQESAQIALALQPDQL